MHATTAHDTRSSQAFAVLLQQHRAIVFKVANTYASDRDDREDLAQEIAAQLWRAWPRYDPARSATTWMYRVALNVGISFLREARGRRQRVVAFDETLHDRPVEVDPQGDDPDAGRRRVLHAFIATLGALDRALLLLYLEQRTTREIADVLGLSPSNTTTRLSRLRQRLRDRATDEGID